MTIKYDLDGQKKAYALWAPFYDLVYRQLLYPAQKAAVDAAAACGRDILEIGVGTGLTLPYFPKDSRVIGVDLSEEMLAKAREKVARMGLNQVVELIAMDACALSFPDQHFDAVTAQFVITLVPDPEKALTEMARVLRPGGEIIISSRLGAEGGFQARFEEFIAPVVKKVGWSSTFKLSRIMDWAKSHGNIELIHVRRGLYFKVARLKKTA